MNSLSRPFEELLITTVNDGPFFVKELFQKKYAHVAPEVGNHMVCFYRHNNHHMIPLGYLNFLQHEEVMLAGGGMTDGRTFKYMSGDLADRISDSGGVLFHMLRFAFDHFKDQCEAYFGHVGDKRSFEVVIPAGFRTTKYEYLLANFHKPTTPERQDYLIDKIHGIGPF